MSGHTATPWIVAQVGGGPKVYETGPGDAAVCQLFDKYGEKFVNAEANAAFIVTACNSHADLVKALEEIATIEPAEGKAAKNRGAMVHMQSIARKAIATLTARKVG